MKPLPVAPLTYEDLQAFSYCYGFVEGQSWDAVMIYVRLSDRRDAELMWQFTQARIEADVLSDTTHLPFVAMAHTMLKWL